MLGFLSLLLPFGKMALQSALQIADKNISDETERERVKADITKQHLQNRTDVLLRGAWWLWVGFAVPLIVYFNKIIIWDKVLGLGTTDPLTGIAADWAGLIIGAIFLVPLGGSAISRIKR